MGLPTSSGVVLLRLSGASPDADNTRAVGALGVLPEAWELVEDGLLDPDGFRDFVFGNAVALWADVTPDFFAGTVIEAAVGKRR